MEYIKLNAENAEAANAIWEEAIEADGLVFKSFSSLEAFLDFFCRSGSRYIVGYPFLRRTESVLPADVMCRVRSGLILPT